MGTGKEAHLGVEDFAFARLGGLDKVVIEDGQDVVADVLEFLLDLGAVFCRCNVMLSKRVFRETEQMGKSVWD